MSSPVQYLPVVVQVPAPYVPPAEYKNWLTAQASPVTVLTASFGASDALVQVTAYISSSAFTSGSIAYTLSYTNEYGLQESVPLYTLSSTGVIAALPFCVRVKGGTIITIATSGTFVATYDAGADLKQVI